MMAGKAGRLAGLAWSCRRWAAAIEATKENGDPKAAVFCTAVSIAVLPPRSSSKDRSDGGLGHQ